MVGKVEITKQQFAHFQNNETSFIVKQQTAQYSDFAEFDKIKCLINLGCDEKNRRIFVVYAFLIPDNQMEKFLLYFIKIVHQYSVSPFFIIFYNTEYVVSTKLNQFRSFYKQLPINYLLNLEQFILMHGSFVV